MVTFFQQFIFGLVQGVAEWLPISSEGVLLLVQSNFFGSIEVNTFIKQALFLHLGTFFAALIYFRKDVKEIFRGILNYRHTDPENKKLIKFLFITTLISGILGLAVLQLLEFYDLTKIHTTSVSVNFFVGFMLLITGFLQLRSSFRNKGHRTIFHLNNTDSILLGLSQGFSPIPGLSRSGLTVSTLLFRNIDDYTALKLSFLMSLPIVLAGNILLNITDIGLITGMFWGMIFAFIFGLLTIHILMKIAKKVRFGWFVIFIASMMILAGIIQTYL